MIVLTKSAFALTFYAILGVTDMSVHRRNNLSVSLDVPRLLLKYAAGLGVDVNDICQQVGLEAASIQNLEGRLSFEEFDALWEAVARRSNDPTFGLHFGEAAPNFSTGHILFAVMMNCATLGDALERFCRYHGLLVDGATPQLCDEGQCSIFNLEGMAMLGQQYAEAILAMLRVTVGRLTENRVRPTEVRLAHPSPLDVSEHQRIFSAPLLFDQPGYRLVFDREALGTSIFLANPALLTTLEQFAQRLLAQLTLTGPWTGRVSETVGKLLLRGEKPSISKVAGTLAISPRHLQNKLQLEGITYQKLLDTVRQQMAQDGLRRDGMTICDVAFLLGFSEQSAFNHAFKRWTGMTPLEYSNNHLIDPQS
jgi:AraC-like DNA-binding protein